MCSCIFYILYINNKENITKTESFFNRNDNFAEIFKYLFFFSNKITTTMVINSPQLKKTRIFS